MISRAREAEVLRLFHAERWSVGTIARQLGMHHSTVRRVLSRSGTPEGFKLTRVGIADSYIPMIVETLQKYPTLTARRLWEMAKTRGYPGGQDYFRAIVARYRPRQTPEAYLRLRTLPGEQAQVDWAHFGKVTIGKATRALMAFVMVLSWSRHLFVRFYLNAKMGSFLRGHVEAFEYFGGVPRCLLYDNLKSAVLERAGDAIRFHPTLLELTSHYRFEPRPVAPRRGNEKGRVERAIRYVRSSFFAARQWKDVAELNELVQQWAIDVAGERWCPEENEQTVMQAFLAGEKAHLLPLPDEHFPAHEVEQVQVGKTPYVRFDLNDYSIPHIHVQKTLTVVAELARVRIVDGSTLIAEHQRCWGRREQIEDPAHIQALVAAKGQAREHRGVDLLYHVVPVSRELFQVYAERGANLGQLTITLVRLLQEVGPSELTAAIGEVLKSQAIHTAALRNVLERRRFNQGKPPTAGRPINKDPRASLPVTPHSLAEYDQLAETDDD
jgi:transposase